MNGYTPKEERIRKIYSLIRDLLERKNKGLRPHELYNWDKMLKKIRKIDMAFTYIESLEDIPAALNSVPVSLEVLDKLVYQLEDMRRYSKIANFLGFFGLNG